jgi:hypothetical protein
VLRLIEREKAVSDKTYEYDVVIKKVDGIDGAFVAFPYDLYCTKIGKQVGDIVRVAKRE